MRDDKVCKVVLDENGYNIRLARYSGFLIAVTWNGKIRVSGSATFEFDSGSWKIINNEIIKGQEEISKWMLLGGGLEGFKSSAVVNSNQKNIKPSQLEFGGIYQRANSSKVVIWFGEGKLYKQGDVNPYNRGGCDYIFAEVSDISEIRGTQCNINQIDIACEHVTMFDTRSTKPNNLVKKVGQLVVADLSSEINVNVVRPSDNYICSYKIITKIYRDSVNKTLNQWAASQHGY